MTNWEIWRDNLAARAKRVDRHWDGTERPIENCNCGCCSMLTEYVGRHRLSVNWTNRLIITPAAWLGGTTIQVNLTELAI